MSRTEMFEIKNKILESGSVIALQIEECHAKKDFSSDFYVNLCKEENRLRDEWHKLPFDVICCVD